jgi:hypothetical protein
MVSPFVVIHIFNRPADCNNERGLSINTHIYHTATTCIMNWVHIRFLYTQS